MKISDIILIILGMTAVTYLPRAIPFFLVDKLKFNKKVEKFLKLIPYTAMSALVFPGVFMTDEANPIIGIVGALVAGILAFRRLPVMVCVLGAIFADLLIYMIV